MCILRIMDTEKLLIYRRGCPNCGGPIEDARLARGLPCALCSPGEAEPCRVMAERGTLKAMASYCKTREKVEAFSSFMEALTGFSPWSLQITWARRVFLGRSFAVVAPPGMGKTTFGRLMALFLEGKSLIMVPTRALVHQVGEAMVSLASRGGLKKKILLYTGKKGEKEAIAGGEGDVVVVTSAFFHRNLDLLKGWEFSFLFVDDVDSFLKGSRGVEGLFTLLGFSQEEISLALKPRKSPEDLARLEEVRSQPRKGILVVSSATLRPRTRRVLLFRHLLGFDIQQALVSLRKVVDVAQPVGSWEEMLEVSAGDVARLGKGGLVFVSPEYGQEGVARAVEFYRDRGYRVLSYLEMKPSRLLEEMAGGDFHVAVGLAHLGNPLVRGIDLPRILKYALFLGVPKRLLPTRLSLAPASLHTLLALLLPLFEGEEREKALELSSFLRRYLRVKEEALDRFPRVKARAQEAKDFLEKCLAREEFRHRIETSPQVFLMERDGETYVVVGDASTYLQASGRVSRLLAGGMTTGLAVVYYTQPKALESLKRRLPLYTHQEVRFRSWDEVDLPALLARMEEERRRGVARESRDPVKTSLVVVESPHKARTLASFFGRPQMRTLEGAMAYEIPLGDRILVIAASLGHVEDLTVKEGFFGVLEGEEGFLPFFDTIKVCRATGEQHTELEELEARCPQEVWDKEGLLKGLAGMGFEVDEVLVATDPDAEGEKIAYDLALHLRPFNSRVARVEFHEVTPGAFREALASPRDLDRARVKAQLTRRILDRWVGFTLSRKLWEAFGRRTLSAGRVQTPVLGWIIERAREAARRKAVITFRLAGRTFSLEMEDVEKARELFSRWEDLSWRVEGGETVEKGPPPPFTTDTLLEEANRVLGLSAGETMALLQELFEEGLITYHRTDSLRVSPTGMYQVARPYIEEHWGGEFFHPRAWGEGGAHEAIRPTRPRDERELEVMMEAGLLSLNRPRKALSLYRLIFRRFMASQMKAARLVQARVVFSLDDHTWQEEVFLKVEDPGFLLALPLYRPLDLSRARLEKGEIRLVPRVPLYTQGSLIQEMKRRGLGRPSTYAQIVSTLLARRYVVEKGGRLVPTALGKRVWSFLQERYPRYVDEALTRRLEEAMDAIEEGRLDYQEVLREIHGIKALLD